MSEIEKTRTQEISRLHAEVVGHLRQSLEKAIRIGQLLTEQKESLRHGEFTKWINSNLPFTDRTAKNYIRLYAQRARIKTKNVSDLRDAYKILLAPRKKEARDRQPKYIRETINDARKLSSRSEWILRNGCDPKSK
ncbi:MAG: DUF3102 domain-containing protein [candidate division Zixibacteria bacterium]|nr:DUF3102 domain-containing protein [candidate division Zixibacteria bacterium]